LAGFLNIINQGFAFLCLDFLAGQRRKGVYQLICIDYSPFPALHLPVRQVDHAVGEMMQVLGPVITKPIKDIEKNPEMVLLFAGHDVNEGIKRPILVAHDGRPNVLGHIETGSILAKQNLLIKLDRLEVDPYRAVLLAIEDSLFEALENLILAVLVRFRLIVVASKLIPIFW